MQIFRYNGLSRGDRVMKEYTELEIEVIRFGEVDIITESDPTYPEESI